VCSDVLIIRSNHETCHRSIRSSTLLTFCVSYPPSFRRLHLCGGLAVVGLDGRLEGLGVGADDLADLVAVLEEEESGHGADAELLRNVGDLVDVDLVEARVGVGAGEPGSSVSNAYTRVEKGENVLDDLRGDDLARAAPGGEAVEDEKGVLDLKRRVEVGLAAIRVSFRFLFYN
jgi:hypothetical protein